ncbi:MAG: 6-bladed beta-propeller [Myxococcota bacterium]
MNLRVPQAKIFERRVRRPLLAASLCLALLAGVVSACQTPPGSSDPGVAVATPDLVWPGAPNRARIRWETEIRSAADLGIRPGFFRRLWDWVVGQDAPHLVRPHGLSVDPDGRLWVADSGARCVHVFDAKRRVYMELPRDGDPGFLSPIAVVHDPSGVAYVSDSARNVIRRLDRKGRDLGEWDGNGELSRPTGLAFDPRTGLLWVVDTGNHRLLAMDDQGRIRRVVGGRGEGLGRFNFPTHIVIGPAGRLFVTDTLNFRIQILSDAGESLGSIGSAGDGPGFLSKPKGVALDGDGHVYVVDGMFDNVQIFDETGPVLLHFGSHGPARGEFWLPAGIWIDGADRIYVADGYNRRIQVFRYLGG